MNETEIELHMITNPREIIQSVGEWANRQPWHPKHAPDLGVAEEIGEACHAVLKNYQGIRGFDNADKFHAALKDALGDVMVYLSHWCCRNNVFFNLIEEPVEVPAAWTFRKSINQAMMACALMLTEESEQAFADRGVIATMIARSMQLVAAMHGWHLIDDCLAPTWHKVRQRDWNKDKMSGGSAEVAAGQVEKAEEKAKKEHPTATDVSAMEAAILQDIIDKKGHVLIRREWLEVRGYTAEYFARLLNAQFPASALEQDEETLRIAAAARAAGPEEKY